MARERKDVNHDGMPCASRRVSIGVAEAVSTTEAASRKQVYHEQVLPEVDVLLRVALSLTGQLADAEDLVQDTLLRAWRSFDTFDGRYPRAWLLTILRNAHVNGHRRQRPSLLRDPDATAEQHTADASPSAEDSVLANRFDDIVEAALDTLPDTFRQVVVLVDVDGLSYAEAARLLDVPEGTVMSRLHRGRAKIRQQLAAAGLAPRRRM